MNRNIPAIIFAFEKSSTGLYLSSLGGMPTILRIIISLQNSENISSIYIASNQKDLIYYCERYGVEPLNDSQIYDESFNISTLARNINNHKEEFNELIIINARYPFLTTPEVDKVINSMTEDFDVFFSSKVQRIESFSIASQKRQKNKEITLKETFNDLQSVYAFKLSKTVLNGDYITKDRIKPVEINWTFPHLITNEEDLYTARRLVNSFTKPNIRNINMENLDIIFLDFDGVLTDNYLLTDKQGNEVIKNSKYDSYAIYRLVNEFKIPVNIITSELSETHKKRAEKINVPIIQSKLSKKDIIRKILDERKILPVSRCPNQPKSLFIGNDINDLSVLSIVDLFCCPSDSHPTVISNSDFIFESKGGEHVIRELVELISFNMGSTFK